MGFGPGLLGTRCAGPLDGDLTPAGPMAEVPIARIRHARRFTVRLDRTSDFTAGGFTGKVSAHLTLVDQRPPPAAVSHPTLPPAPRFRTVREPLTLLAAHGSELVATAGGADCAALDSCGLTGALSWDPTPTRVRGFLEVTGPARLSESSLLAVLRGRRRIPGTQVDGTVTWPGATVSDATTQDGNRCADPVRLFRQQLELSQSRAAYGYPGTLRNRCPGRSTSDRRCRGRSRRAPSPRGSSPMGLTGTTATR